MNAKLMVLTVCAAALVIAGCSKGANSSSGQAPASGGTTAQAPAAGQGGAGGAGAGGTSGAARPGGSGQGGSRRFAIVPVQAVPVVVAPLNTDNNTAGTVMPVTQSNVAAQVSGVVLTVLHKAGDFVREGTPIVQLDDSAFTLAVKNSQAALDNAKINLAMGQQTTSGSGPKLTNQLQAAQVALASAQKTYQSQKALFDLGAISSAQLDNASSALAQAQANVDAAQLALDQNNSSDTQNTAQLQLAVDQAANQLAISQLTLKNATITAPFTGQIAAVNVTPGSFVGTNTTVFILVSVDKQINFTEPPTDATNFHVGDTVQFNYNGKNYPVKIAQTPSAPLNGVVPMVATVPASLPATYGAVGTITYRLTVATGPQIPIAALQSRANINYVDTVVNNKAVEVPVIILAESGTTAVVQGVNGGDQVIVNPPPGLLNGSTVQVVSLPTQGQPQGAATGQPGAQGQGNGQRMGGQAGTGSGQYGNGTGQGTGSRTGNRQGQASAGGSANQQPAAGGTQ